MKPGPKPRPLAERFEEKVDRVTPAGPWGDCHMWTASKNSGGYGHIGRGKKSDGHIDAHVLAWELANGPVPDGKEVCHRCDIRLCCNEDHLFVDTRRGNMKDAVSKGRMHLGELHGLASLNATAVKNIRAERGLTSQAELAKRYGVAQTTISAVQLRKSWRHIL